MNWSISTVGYSTCMGPCLCDYSLLYVDNWWLWFGLRGWRCSSSGQAEFLACLQVLKKTKLDFSCGFTDVCVKAGAQCMTSPYGAPDSSLCPGCFCSVKAAEIYYRIRLEQGGWSYIGEKFGYFWPISLIFFC